MSLRPMNEVERKAQLEKIAEVKQQVGQRLAYLHDLESDLEKGIWTTTPEEDKAMQEEVERECREYEKKSAEGERKRVEKRKEEIRERYGDEVLLRAIEGVAKFGLDALSPEPTDKCLKCGREYQDHFDMTCYEERPDLKPVVRGIRIPEGGDK